MLNQISNLLLHLRYYKRWCCHRLLHPGRNRRPGVAYFSLLLNLRRPNSTFMEQPEESSSSPAAKFALPVNSEHKATEFNPFSFSAPHMRAFHLSWFSFFCCFCSTFATPPLLPIIRDNLNLTATDIGNAGIASVSGAVFARVIMGTACDLVGPRIASASLILLTAPPVFLTALISSPASFLLARFFTGFSLASFVSTQFWMSSMFSPTKVGQANSFAAGWGNLGGGAIQLVMPLLYSLIVSLGATRFTAWRIAFLFPGLMQTMSAIAVLAFGQDLPDGSFQQLRRAGAMHEESFPKVFTNAVTNYRGWILALTYGFCFGVEMTVDNIIAQYFYDRFDLDIKKAGIVAASFGLANIFTRPGGGFISDVVAARFGMRGRLWSLWAVQTVGGVLCITLGLMDSLTSSIIVMLLFSFFVQAACGLTFGVVPFVSRRSLGVVSGITGGGGNVGAILTQWGGMFCGPNGSTTEEDYYASEWSSKEKEKGYDSTSMKFARNSRSERGNQEAIAPVVQYATSEAESLLAS